MEAGDQPLSCLGAWALLCVDLASGPRTAAASGSPCLGRHGAGSHPAGHPWKDLPPHHGGERGKLSWWGCPHDNPEAQEAVCSLCQVGCAWPPAIFKIADSHCFRALGAQGFCAGVTWASPCL